MIRRRVLLAVAIAALAISLQQCGGGGASPTSPPAPTIGTIVVSGWFQPIRVGDAAQLTATAILTDGSSRLVTAEAAWQSSNPAVANVQGGLVTGHGEGSVTISATYSGQKGEQRLTIERGNIPLGGLACGFERWSVKTLSDSAATQVDLARVVPTTIRELNQFPTRCSGLPNTRAFSEEFTTYEVIGRVTYVASEDDRDYHVALADPMDSSYTIVTEVADTACSGAIVSPYRAVMGQTRASFMELIGGRSPSSLVGMTLRVRGVGFYDFNHGQIGRSRNCIELHPLTFMERVQ